MRVVAAALTRPLVDVLRLRVMVARHVGEGGDRGANRWSQAVRKVAKEGRCAMVGRRRPEHGVRRGDPLRLRGRVPAQERPDPR